jgi:hypothetical protein
VKSCSACTSQRQRSVVDSTTVSMRSCRTRSRPATSARPR